MSVFITGEITNETGKRKPRKKYHTKYSNKYEREYEWVGPSEKGDTYALCRWCQIDICIKSVGAKGLRDHDQTGRHKQKAKDHIPTTLNSGSSVYPVLNLEVVEPSDACEDDTTAPLEQRPNTPQTPNTPRSSSEEGIMVPESSLTSQEIGQASLYNIYSEKDVNTEPHTSDVQGKHYVSKADKVPENLKRNSGLSVVIEYDNPVSAPTSEKSKKSKKSKTKREGKGKDVALQKNSEIKPKAPKTKTAKQGKSGKNEMLSSVADDLTCNVCGQEYTHWTQLKQHLLDHIMHAHNEQLSKQQENVGNEKLIPKSKKCKNAKTRKKNKTKIKKDSHLQRVDDNINGEEIKNCNLGKKKENVCSPINSNSLKDFENIAPRNASISNTKQHKEYIIENESITSDSQEKDVDDPDEADNITEKQRTTPLHCRVCRMTFYSRGDLATHQREEHNNGRPYKCDQCDKFFTTKNHMEVHVKHKHSEGPDPCQCSVCEKVLSSRTNLRIHMRIHKGERPFECPVCHKTFSRKANMETHVVYHTGERRFTCEVCGQSFFAINALKRHTKLHTGERDYACDICGATYVTGTDLRRHKLKHDDVKPYPCNLCDKQFTRSHDLKVHVRYHNKELRYSCNVCNKQFVESGNYKRHMRRHTGERPYNCTICLMTFSQIHHLKTHMRSNHSEVASGNTEEAAVAAAAAASLQRTVNTAITVATVPVGSHNNVGTTATHNNVGTTATSLRNIRTVGAHSLCRRNAIKTASTAVIHHTQDQTAQASHQISYHQSGLLGQENSNNNSSISIPCGTHMSSHTVGFPITTTSAPHSHSAQIHNAGNQQHNNFLHPYNSHIYNHIPHFQAPLFDMCQQQPHVTPHFTSP